jgi:hypothetical protein
VYADTVPQHGEFPRFYALGSSVNRSNPPSTIVLSYRTVPYYLTKV